MKELINDQTIDFDIHNAGDGRPSSLNGLHMHKRMNGKKYRGVDVLIPLDGSEKVIFRPTTISDLHQTQIINEIRRALSKDKSKREMLVKEITSVIRRYSDGLPPNDQIDAIRQGAERIARIFSKNADIEDEMKQSIKERLEFYISSHKKDDGNLFYIKQDFLRHRIKIGDDLEAINTGNEKRRFK